MKIVVLTVGTDGDVVPYAGLGARLAAQGHDVAIATHVSSEQVVRNAGLEFRRLPIDMKEELAPRHGRSGMKIYRMWSIYREHWDELCDASLEACADADLVAVSALGLHGVHIAEALDTPSIGLFLQPLDPTGDFAPPIVTTTSFGRRGNRYAGRAFNGLGQAPVYRKMNQLRGRLGLPRTNPDRWYRGLNKRGWPILYGYSPTIVPKPADWPHFRRPVGYWWAPPLAADWRPPAEVVDFLDDGDKPVFVGFGSMPAVDGQRLAETVAKALRRAGRRGVIQGGWSNLQVKGDDMLTIGPTPHDWLFPRMAAVVHHGGAGTTAAGLRAGVPTVTVPFASDQPFWANRLIKLGVSPGSVGVKRVDAEILAALVSEAVTDPGYSARARLLAGQVRQEDGSAAVLAEMERIAELGRVG
ncbi:glycosyltransferase [Naumannella halotolerans]|uniref:UDP:flavonoid glycosyltransferase YjiC (YdhE family) n=1 Tax=Naumannella halotolerans TaxID=993414 RepID=A0A4R7J2D9_9ACTN|nr:glycosyltransferase [Naumannella halotolerans]TDT31175.1 UDP:flavonoid glycosyltransferase YjiC (YdhE family) [Naumannella halotolerans]